MLLGPESLAVERLGNFVVLEKTIQDDDIGLWPLASSQLYVFVVDILSSIHQASLGFAQNSDQLCVAEVSNTPNHEYGRVLVLGIPIVGLHLCLFDRSNARVSR